MSEPVYIHSATRSMSFGYKTEHGYDKTEIRWPLSRLLSERANDILRVLPVSVDAIFVSNQFPDRGASEELVVNQLVDSLVFPDREGRQLRLSGAMCVRVETATNGLTALREAINYLQSQSGDTVLVIGGEKVTPAEFADEEYYAQNVGEWVKEMVEYIASALSPTDRRYCRSMPAAMGLILNYYTRTRRIDFERLKNLIRQLSLRSYRNVLANANGYQRHRQIFRGKSIEEVYDYERDNPMLVYPLRKLDMSPFNDGAGALLISRHQKLDMLDGSTSQADVAITGCAVAQDILSLNQRGSLDSFFATQLAAKRAYVQAGLDLRGWQTKLSPLILEHHDAFVPLTLINLEDLQLFHNHWEVLSFLEESYLKDEQCPLLLNPSGGLLEGHPFAGTAIIKLAECFARLTARRDLVKDWFGPINVEGKAPTTAIVQSFGGIGANVGVAVLDKCDQRTGNVLRKRDRTVHYPNRGMRLTPVEPPSEQKPESGKIVSLARIKMPFIGHEAQFVLPNDETVLALIQTLQGKFYALATARSEGAELTPEDVCNEEIFVSLDKVGDYLSFRVRSRQQRKPIKFRVVA